MLHHSICAKLPRMGGLRFSVAVLAGFAALNSAFGAADFQNDGELVDLPAVGSCRLRVITPTVLELRRITGQPSTASSHSWDFVDSHGTARLPRPTDLTVNCGETQIGVREIGFKRRVLYAPFKHPDLRVANYLYLVLSNSIPSEQKVEVRNPNHRYWSADVNFTARNDPLRLSPAVHVNQTGYLASYPKTALVGYYLGNLGELTLGSQQSGTVGEAPSRSSAKQGLPTFALLNAVSEKPVYHGRLTPRKDLGFPFSCYQQVLEADFTDFKTPGQYRLQVDGLGASFPFFIDDAVAGAFARTYALGIYHQRCGTANALPFTRFVHGPCHTAPAEVPDGSSKFESVNDSLKKESADYKDNPRHTAKPLDNVDASLYPFVNRGPVDVSGGHHDAGDYSKYTINSAAFVHHLVFAADAFPGVNQLDNLGLPESGDGKGDILQEAKYEADFLAKMQDADGGFYFLVYPRDREYEDNVTPDKGDPQVVFPKTTAVTAAACAALAQCASSPNFKRQFPEAAAQYLAKAKKGWEFLQRAIALHGKDGAYQKITHYGDEFMHDDELAWAACELFLATGESSYESKLLDWLNPSDPNTRRWGWWRLYDAYGCAIRSYAFAARTGRLKKEQLNPLFLEQCEAEIVAAGEDQLRRAENSAYGTSFPEETKRALSAGWYFSSDAAFDLAVAYQLDYPVKRDPRPRLLRAILSNLNYEQGCNPVNVVYLTGLGWKRQREIVDQFAQNDRRVLPPSGIPLGNIQAGFGWNSVYEDKLDKLAFPSDANPEAPYPFYDRWGDAFNLSQEFVTVNQARGLAYCAWLMARTSLKDQPWKAEAGHIRGLPPVFPAKNKVELTLSAAGLDFKHARIVWECAGREPSLETALVLPAGTARPAWIEAEAQLPDGRRVFASVEAPK